MNEPYPDKPQGLDPSLKARQSFIRMDRYGGQIGNIAWAFGDPAGVELSYQESDGTRSPVRWFGSTRWSRYGWPITAWSDDVAWVAQTAANSLRRRLLEDY